MPKRAPQQSLDLPPRFGWGGARDRAGRPPAGEEPGISHRRSIELDDRVPVHVTVRVRDHVWSVLRTPAEVRPAVAYVAGNHASHTRRRGERLVPGFVDPCSSAAERGPDGLPPPVSAPRSWLLRSGGVVAGEPEAVCAAAA